jgi:hypothetical protein
MLGSKNVAFRAKFAFIFALQEHECDKTLYHFNVFANSDASDGRMPI